MKRVGLASYIRKKRHEASALDREVELALVLCRNAAALASEDAGMRVEELLKNIDVLVVDVLDVVDREKALFHMIYMLRAQSAVVEAILH